jgi:hypothetical protein
MPALYRQRNDVRRRHKHRGKKSALAPNRARNEREMREARDMGKETKREE